MEQVRRAAEIAGKAHVASMPGKRSGTRKEDVESFRKKPSSEKKDRRGIRVEVVIISKLGEESYAEIFRRVRVDPELINLSNWDVPVDKFLNQIGKSLERKVEIKVASLLKGFR